MNRFIVFTSLLLAALLLAGCAAGAPPASIAAPGAEAPASSSVGNGESETAGSSSVASASALPDDAAEEVPPDSLPPAATEVFTRKPPYPPSASIAMEPLAQNPELPNGCEITSLTAVLNYYGYAADKVEMATNWLPTTDSFYGANPEVEYMGYPDRSGWYCYQGPIITAGNGYLEAAGSPLRAVEKTGADAEALKLLLSEGTPVLVWVTVDLRSPRYSQEYSWSINGAVFVPLVNAHCLVLTGYSEEHNVYYTADPMLRYSEIEQPTFIKLFEAMGSRAVILQDTEKADGSAA